MKPKILTVLVVIVLVAGAAWLASEKDVGDMDAAGGILAGEVAISKPEGAKALEEDKVPPDFYIIRDGREPETLSGIKGKYVFINFWNTWCPPCRAEMPDLNKLYNEFGDKNVEFIFINIAAQEKSVEDVTAFLIENNYSIPVYLDRLGEVAGAYGVPGVPTTVILGRDGEILYAAAGPVSYKQAKAFFVE